MIQRYLILSFTDIDISKISTSVLKISLLYILMMLVISKISVLPLV